MLSSNWEVKEKGLGWSWVVGRRHCGGGGGGNGGHFEWTRTTETLIVLYAFIMEVESPYSTPGVFYTCL